MSDKQRFEVDLDGCRVEPLASYLKALGVLRLVGQQKDKNARGFWRGEHFVLDSSLDRDALMQFFRSEWEPTPVVAPWNGGSGFWPSTSDEALRTIEASTDPRLRSLAATIAIARAAIRDLRLVDAPEKGVAKTNLLVLLRARMSDKALEWLDAATVLTDNEPAYPALLGTGGNDGRQDFSNNFMQRILQVFAQPSGIDGALLGIAGRTRTKGSLGQFSPTALDRSDAWDFVLAIEGAQVLAGAATRRLESRDNEGLAFPFHVRAASAPSLAEGEDGHGEIWLPRWTTSSSFREVRRLFAEGRAKTTSRSAANGLDFARSVASLGVDRGVSEFVRVSFQPRNGKNHFATALGRIASQDAPTVRLLGDIDAWLQRFRQKASGDNVPARVALAGRRLEQAMFEAVGGGSLGTVLVELGNAELALSRSLAFAAKAFLNPLPRLQAGWTEAVADGSVEQRLGAALAGRRGMRGRLLPLDPAGRFGRNDQEGFVFVDRPLVDNLHALLNREDVEESHGQSLPESTGMPRCSLSDIAAFIGGRVDDVVVEGWLRGAVLVEGGLVLDVPRQAVLPPATFAVLSLVHGRRLGEEQLPRSTGVLARACAGDAAGATAAAIRRLNSSGRPLPIHALTEPPKHTRRIAAALAFPLSSAQRRLLESMVLSAAIDGPADDFSIAISQEQL